MIWISYYNFLSVKNIKDYLKFLLFLKCIKWNYFLFNSIKPTLDSDLNEEAIGFAIMYALLTH